MRLLCPTRKDERVDGHREPIRQHENCDHQHCRRRLMTGGCRAIARLTFTKVSKDRVQKLSSHRLLLSSSSLGVIDLGTSKLGILRDLGPVAQMMDESEPDILASEMFSTHRDGRTVRAIITLQRRWRKKRLQCRIQPCTDDAAVHCSHSG